MTDSTLPDPNAKDLLIGIAGAGLMGRGIAQVAVQGGCRVKLYDADPQAAIAAVAFIRQMFARAAEKGQIPAEVVDAIVARVQVVAAVADLAQQHALRCEVPFRLAKNFPDHGKSILAGSERHPGLMAVFARQAAHGGRIHVRRVGQDQVELSGNPFEKIRGNQSALEILPRHVQCVS